MFACRSVWVYLGRQRSSGGEGGTSAWGRVNVLNAGTSVEPWPQPDYKLPPCKAISDFTVFSLVIYLLGAVGVSPVIPCTVLWVSSRVWRGYFSVFCAHVHRTSQTWRPKEVVFLGKSAGCRVFVFQKQSFWGKRIVCDLETFHDKIYSLMQEAGRLLAKQPVVVGVFPWTTELLGTRFLLCSLPVSWRGVLSTKLSDQAGSYSD